MLLASSFFLFSIAAASIAYDGDASDAVPKTYRGSPSAAEFGGKSLSNLSSATYERTRYGAAGTSIGFTKDGSLVLSPAIDRDGVGIAISKDYGKTWQQNLPGGSNQPRNRPTFRQADGRWFFWSGREPGIDFAFSEDEGQTWYHQNPALFSAGVQDGGYLVSGKPVFSRLYNGASQILYFTGPSLRPATRRLEKLGNFRRQLIWKSVDRGNTWIPTPSAPSLDPKQDDGFCDRFSKKVQQREKIIWGDGFVRPNGTVMFGVRRCERLAVAISDDEGNSWRIVDIPQTNVGTVAAYSKRYKPSDTYMLDQIISQDLKGNIYVVWAGPEKAVYMIVSRDNAETWSRPIVVSPPVEKDNFDVMKAKNPVLIHHPSTPGRAALSMYGRFLDSHSWDAYIAETMDIAARSPTFTYLKATSGTEGLQKLYTGTFDEGAAYADADVLEVIGMKYHPITGDLVAGFAEKMCDDIAKEPKKFKADSCVDEWDYRKKGNNPWQGFVVFGRHGALDQDAAN